MTRTARRIARPSRIDRLVLRLVFTLLALPSSIALAQLPAFLQVGSRLTWNGGGSSLQGSRLVPDPNGWIWQNNQWNRVESTYGGGGVGLIQIDILSSSPEGVVGDVRSYLNTDLQSGVYALSGVDAVVGDQSALSTYWVAPARLVALQTGWDGTTRVWRGPRVINGAQYDTVSIATLAQGSYSSNTYDVATGLLLFGGTMDAQPGVMATDPNGTVVFQNQGAVSYSHQLFLGVRQLQVPWAGRPAPDWAAPGLTLVYQGQSRAELGGGGGLPPLPGSAMAISYAFTQRLGSALLGYQVSQLATTQGLPPDQVTLARAFGSAAMDGLWVAPDVLGGLQPGQVIDQDPFTGMQTYFGGVQNGGAVIVYQGRGDMLENYYDPNSGFLVFTRYRKQAANVGFQVNELWYTGTQ